MDEKALQYAYDLFKADGYEDSIDDFKNLLDSNPEAFKYSYGLFKADGYEDSEEDFATLLGVKKNENLNQNITGLNSGDGGLEQLMLEEQDSINLTGNLLIEKQQQLQNLDSQIQSREPNVVGEDIPITPTEFED